MAVDLVAKRYAKAAEKFLDKDIAGEDISSLRVLGQALHLKAKKILENPTLSQSEKKQFLDAVSDQLNLSDSLQSLKKVFGYCIEVDRAEIIPALCIELADRLQEKSGYVEVNIETAQPLNDSQKQKIQQAFTQSGSQLVKLNETINKELTAGFIARSQNRLLDLSLKSRLEKVRREVL